MNTNILVKNEIKRLKEYHRVININYNNEDIKTPFDINHIINHIMIIMSNHMSNNPVMKREDVILVIDKFLEELYDIHPGNISHRCNLIMAVILIRSTLSSKQVTKKLKLSKPVLLNILAEIKKKIYKNIITPGTTMGANTATSISGILTQLTLNTFHVSGSETQVVQTMKTFKGLLQMSENQDIKSLYTKIYLDKSISVLKTKDLDNPSHIKHNSRCKRKVDDIIKLFKINKLKDINKDKIYLTGDDDFFKGSSVIKKDDKYIKFYMKHINNMNQFLTYSPSSIRLSFLKNKLFDRKINILDIVSAIIKKYPMVEIIPLGETILRLYVNMSLIDTRKTDILELMDNIFINIDNVVITGIDGIESISCSENNRIKTFDSKNVKKYETELVLTAIGSNFDNIISIPGIDPLRTYSNDVLETYRKFGIEAARLTLIKSLAKIIQDNQTYVDISYLHLLTDVMCHDGKFVKINIKGCTEISEPNQFISFEEMSNGVAKSGKYAMVDNMTSPTSNIMTCQVGPYSDGLCQIERDNGL